MNSVSVTGKNWILKKFDQEKIIYLKDNFFLDEITAKLLALRNIKKEDINNKRWSLLIDNRVFTGTIEGKDINYEGATGVEFTEVGEAFGSFLEKEIKGGKFKTKKQR